MSQVKVVLPMIPPSPNQLRRKYRHFMAYKRLRDSWQKAIFYGSTQIVVREDVMADRVTMRIWTSQGMRLRVSIHIEHLKLFDPDNLMGAVKPVLDSLTRLEYIVDDSEKHIELVVTQEKSKVKQTTIIISPMAMEAENVA